MADTLKVPVDLTFMKHIKSKADQMGAKEVVFGHNFAILCFEYPYQAKGAEKQMGFWYKNHGYGLIKEGRHKRRLLVTNKPLSQIA